jgi:cytoskeleton protein RodZ
MNQIGPLFRDARTKSGRTVEDASRETKIAKKYLLGIENENFDIFPGETYLIGFLRNYAQFLGLDPDEMVRKYRDYKIQEQPAPIEQLTARPRNTRKYFLLALISVIIVATVLYFSLSGRKGEQEIIKRREKGEESQKRSREEQTSKINENIIAFEEEEVIKDFKKGDRIDFPLGEKKYSISIDNIDENLDFSVESIPFSLQTDEYVEIDFDRDGRKDLLVRPNRLGEGMVNLTLKRLYKSDLLAKEMSPLQKDKTTGEVESGPPDVVIVKEDELTSPIPVVPKTGFQIVSSYEKTAITMSVRGLTTAYLGFTVDNGKKEEKLMKNGDELNITAQETLRLSIANANGIELKINNVPVTLGESGQVVAKVVRWYRDKEKNDLFHLVIDDLEK